MKLFAAITKRDDEERMVWGYASTEALDSQGEVVKLDAIKGAWDDYMRFANIREMHQPSAVGKCKEYEFDEAGVQIGVKVVDDAAWKKVTEGVYSGFSIGGRVMSKVDNTITALRLTEISLVDRPANPEALISVWKGEEIDTSGAGQDGEVSKGMWTAARMAEVIGALNDVQQMLAWEEGVEGEGPALPDEMKDHVVALMNLLARYAAAQAEETAAGTDAGKADDAGDMKKAGARYSKATKQQLADLHAMVKSCDEHLGKMGYMDDEAEDDAGKADTEDDIAKLADLESKVAGQEAALAEIAKALGMAEGDKYLDAIAKLSDRIKELEALPEPPKGAARAVDKADDAKTGDSKLDALEKQLDGLTPEQAAVEVMKFVHQNGARRIA